MELVIQETIEEILKRLSTPFRKIRIEKRDADTWRVNIESEEPSLLIGPHGENIQALQNLVKIIIWNQHGNEKCNVIVDVDDYRRRQEDNVLKMAERKIMTLQKTQEAQSLPPMSPYFRRLIHLYIAEKYQDVHTESVGEGDFRYLMLKPKVS